jgi:FG-GAP-like repeat
MVTIPAGADPGSVAVVDVNHDGKPDLVVANLTPGTITVLLGDGKGHFRPAPGSPFEAGQQPNDIGIGDFNRDGNIDLVVPNHASPFVTVLLGDGRGAFRPIHIRTDSRPHPHAVAVADYDRDGKLDVAIDSWGDNQIELLRGDGVGRLESPGRRFAVSRRPYHRLRTADFNKDGAPDIVTTNLDGNSVTILLGDGHGGFHEAAGSPFSAGASPWSVAIDDFNGDGNLDLVTIPYDRDLTDPRQVAATVLSGDGHGGFRETAHLVLHDCHQPNRLATGDIDADHRPDIVISCSDSGNIVVFRNTKHGFEQTVGPLPGRPEGVAIADLNGDGRNDIVVASGATNTLTLLFGPF